METPASSFDVVIVGGGLVGASLAVALAPIGLRIAMIESRAFPETAASDDYDERSIALSYQSKKILQGLGIWSAIEPQATPINTVHVSEKGRFGATRLSAKEIAAKALGYVVMYRDLMHAAGSALRQQSNLSRYIPAKLIHVEPAEDAVSLTIETNDGSQKIISAKLLVGADGGQSSTRKLLKIPARSVDYQQQALVANLTVSGSPGTEAFERFTPNGPLALLPLGVDRGDRFALVWTGTVKRTTARMALDDASFLAAVQAEVGHRVGALHKVGKREVFPLHQLVAKRLTARRTVLVGNAAHLLHPVAGQGLNLALRDVAVLSQLLCECQDPGDYGVLDEYTKLRKWDIDLTAATTYSLIQIFGHQSAILSHLRGASLTLLDKIPPLKKRLARNGMGLRRALHGTLFAGKPISQHTDESMSSSAS